METIKENFSTLLSDLSKEQQVCIKKIIKHLNTLKNIQNETIKDIVKKITQYIYIFLKNIKLGDKPLEYIKHNTPMLQNDNSSSFINTSKVMKICEKNEFSVNELFNEVLKDYLLDILKVDHEYEKTIKQLKEELIKLFRALCI